jgi:hypothetical protein
LAEQCGEAVAQLAVREPSREVRKRKAWHKDWTFCSAKRSAEARRTTLDYAGGYIDIMELL